MLVLLFSFYLATVQDQNPNDSTYSVQGVFSLFEGGQEHGGTRVIPGSHKKTYTWELNHVGSHLRAPSGFVFDNEDVIVTPYVPPNGIILFNSRLVHDNAFPKQNPKNVRPVRVAQAVSFQLRRLRSEHDRIGKEAAYFEGLCLSHRANMCEVLRPDYRHEHRPYFSPLPRPQRIESRLSML